MAIKKKAAKKKAVFKPRKNPTVKKKKAVKKKSARRLSLAADDNSMTVSVEFRLGVGEITAKLFRKTALIDKHTIDGSGVFKFDDARSGDELSITGACSGKATLSTNRNTTPSSSSSSPRKYPEGNIFDGLGIN
jgi:hypothetical protein